MKRKAQLGIISLFFSPIGLVIGLVLLYFLFFGGLTLLNSVTRIFGIDVVGGAIADFTRPIAMIMGFYVIYKVVELIASKTGKGIGTSTTNLVMLLGIAVFLFHFAIVGKLFLGVTAPAGGSIQQIDWILVSGGILVGSIILSLLNKKR